MDALHAGLIELQKILIAAAVAPHPTPVAAWAVILSAGISVIGLIRIVRSFSGWIAASRGATIIGCAACMLALSVSARATPATDSTTYLLNKAQWERMDWQKPEGTPIWKLITWTASSDGSVKKATIVLFGSPFKALWIGDVLHLEASDEFVSCDRLEPEIATHFGKPTADDGSIVIPFSDTKSMKMIAMFYQWDLGVTRVTASCGGITSSPADPTDSHKFNWSISIAALGRLPKLTPKFALRCTRQVSYPDETTHDLTEIAMWIDPFMGNVTNADGVAIADSGTLTSTDSQIRFAVTRNGLKSNYAIDRFTGSLRASVARGDNPVATISGDCKKAASLERQF